MKTQIKHISQDLYEFMIQTDMECRQILSVKSIVYDRRDVTQCSIDLFGIFWSDKFIDKSRYLREAFEEIKYKPTIIDTLISEIGDDYLYININEDGSFEKHFELDNDPFTVEFYAHGTAKIKRYAATCDQPGDDEITAINMNVTGFTMYDGNSIPVRFTEQQVKEFSDKISKLIELK